MGRVFSIVSAAFATTAIAAPPAPPPPDGSSTTLSAYVRALQAKDVAGYASTLSPTVVVTRGARVLARSRAEWMKTVAAEFARPGLEIASKGVYSGFEVGDQVLWKAMIVEQDAQIFGDCCVKHRAEILTFGNGKVTAIELTPEFDSRMRDDGRPQGEPAN